MLRLPRHSRERGNPHLHRPNFMLFAAFLACHVMGSLFRGNDECFVCPVIPANAGIHIPTDTTLCCLPHFLPATLWIPSFAGMTG